MSQSLPLSLTLEVAHIQHELFKLSGLKLKMSGEGGSLSVELAEAAGQRWQQARIECGSLSLASEAFYCGEGRLYLANRSPLALEIRQRGEEWTLRFTHPAHPDNGYAQILYASKSQTVRLEFSGARLEDWQGLLPWLAEWKAAGRLTGKAEYGQGRLAVALNIQAGGYASRGGNSAAEKMEMKLALSGEESGEASSKEKQGRRHLRGKLEWLAGDWYHAPMLLRGMRQSFDFAGDLDASGWNLASARLVFPGVGEVNANGQGKWAEAEGGANLRVSAQKLDLKSLGESLIAPLLASQGKLRADFSGTLDVEATLQNGELAAFLVAPQNGSVTLEDNRFTLDGVSGRLEWRNDRQTENALSVKKMAVGRLESGAFNLPVVIWPEKSFAIAGAVSIPLLDGELILRHLAAGMSRDKNEDDWEGALGLSITPVALEKLTEKLDLPIMTGAISADLPVIRYARREAALDGALIIRVFDGYLNCRDLRFIDPFGARPRILLDVDAHHLDLEQLTQTFSFGQITGFVDAGLKGLEIANWRPLAFEARIESSPGSYPRRISQRAVDNITSLGSGGAMAALQSSVLRVFSDFGYRRMGLVCRLENGVCDMRGIPGAERGEQFVIVEGGGIPALTILGYNRRINWDEFLARLKAATKTSGPSIR